MNKSEKLKNILAFISIIFGEDPYCYGKIFELHPDYLIEKYDRYILSNHPEGDWGIHPILQNSVIKPYFKLYKESIFNEQND
jgi:hypothetical protein